MTPTTARRKIIELLAKHEEAIGRLYAEYANRFPRHHALWVQLSEEEYQHAEWLRTLDPAIKDGSLSFAADRFDAKVIDKSLTWVIFQTGRAEKGELTQDEAVAVAMEVESTIIENKCFEVFEKDPPEFRKVLRLLSSSTENHWTTVRKAWKRSGGSQK
jgi:hypothetical protein